MVTVKESIASPSEELLDQCTKDQLLWLYHRGEFKLGGCDDNDFNE